MSGQRKWSLRAWWSKRERDIMYEFDRSADGHWLTGWLGSARQYPQGFRPGSDWPWNGPSFLKELEERGFDITTLRISVRFDPAYKAATDALWAHRAEHRCAGDCPEWDRLQRAVKDAIPHRMIHRG